jgi:hypothetical protein
MEDECHVATMPETKERRVLGAVVYSDLVGILHRRRHGNILHPVSIVCKA